MSELGLLVGSVLFKSAQPLKRQPHNLSALRTAWAQPARNIAPVAIVSPEYIRPDWSPQTTRLEPLPIEESSDESKARAALIAIYMYDSIPTNSGVRDESNDNSALAQSVSRAEESYIARQIN